MELSELGWTPDREEELAPHAAAGLIAARVAIEHRGGYVVYGEEGETRTTVAGRLRHEGATFPAVGDWVALAPSGIIQAVLERRTAFSRRAAGPGGAVVEQVLAANVDVVFVVTALDRDFSLRRLERYLVAAWESGAEPVVVLSKRDLCADVEAQVATVESVAFGVPIHVVSAATGEGVADLGSHLEGSRTGALLGSSGVGKSTLINSLSGAELMRTHAIRNDGRGRHTTTHRELVLLPGSGLMIDTPGLRELQLWESGDGLSETFADVASLAQGCRFGDCSHGSEPGCAVVAAVESGELEPARLGGYEKLQRELAHLERKLDKRAQAEERRRWRNLSRELRASGPRRPGQGR